MARLRKGSSLGVTRNKVPLCGPQQCTRVPPPGPPDHHSTDTSPPATRPCRSEDQHHNKRPLSRAHRKKKTTYKSSRPSPQFRSSGLGFSAIISSCEKHGGHVHGQSGVPPPPTDPAPSPLYHMIPLGDENTMCCPLRPDAQAHFPIRKTYKHTPPEKAAEQIVCRPVGGAPLRGEGRRAGAEQLIDLTSGCQALSYRETWFIPPCVSAGFITAALLC